MAFSYTYEEKYLIRKSSPTISFSEYLGGYPKYYRCFNVICLHLILPAHSCTRVSVWVCNVTKMSCKPRPLRPHTCECVIIVLQPPELIFAFKSLYGVLPVLMYLSIFRYVDDGRPFWQYIVSTSTGCSDLEYFEELYQYYTTEKVGQSVI